MSKSTPRFHGFAISLHWLMALLITGLLILGNYMVSLDESDSLRFVLTQWHKSFGIIVLLLFVIRLMWRLTHRPPALPGNLKPWEVRAAGLTQALLYVLICLIPLSGWLMVSVSPLDLPTLLFNGVHWPHLALFDGVSDKAAVTDIFADIHAIAGNLIIFLLVLHIGAALRHHFVLKDGVMSLMSPKHSDGRWVKGAIPLSIAILLIVTGLIAYGNSGGQSISTGATSSRVSFEFELQNDINQGSFTDATVELFIDGTDDNSSSLTAMVNTASVSTGNSQIESTLTGDDWFHVEQFPQAFFQSHNLKSLEDGGFMVTGDLKIRDKSQTVSFLLELKQQEGKKIAFGGFDIDRRGFELGSKTQEDDSTVGFIIQVKFEFEAGP